MNERSTWMYSLYQEHGQCDASQLGGKGAQLRELAALRYNVPPGFIVACSAYRYFLNSHRRVFEACLDEVSPGLQDDPVATDAVSERIRARIESLLWPEELEHHVLQMYDTLAAPSTAVRSSATAEDGSTRSFAGQFDSFLAVRRNNLCHAISRVWSSLFSTRSLVYRLSTSSTPLIDETIAVLVQKMIDAEVAGTCFTASPDTHDLSYVHVEAVWGLGESLVGGYVEPDIYVIRKSDTKLVSESVGHQERMRIAAEERGLGTCWTPVPGAQVDRRKLSPATLDRIVAVALDVQKTVEYQCDIEWALADNSIFVLQCRPIVSKGPSRHGKGPWNQS